MTVSKKIFLFIQKNYKTMSKKQMFRRIRKYVFRSNSPLYFLSTKQRHGVVRASIGIIDSFLEKDSVNKSTFDKFYRRISVNVGKAEQKQNIQEIKDMLYMNKNTITGTDPKIFYYCDTHKNCASDHIDFEGKIYVDRFWKNVVPKDQHKPILYYIKNRGVVTVQEITRHKPYLCTRRYCRHKLHSLNTSDVLTSSVNKIAKQFVEVGQPKTMKYVNFRDRILKGIE